MITPDEAPPQGLRSKKVPLNRPGIKALAFVLFSFHLSGDYLAAAQPNHSEAIQKWKQVGLLSPRALFDCVCAEITSRCDYQKGMQLLEFHQRSDPKTYSQVIQKLKKLIIPQKAPSREAELLVIKADMLWHDEKRTSEARSILTECIEKHPEYPMAYSELGFIQLEGGNTAEAEALLKEAVKVAKPKNIEQIRLLGTFYAMTGESKKCAAAYNDVLKLDPSDTGARRFLSSGDTAALIKKLFPKCKDITK